MKKTGWFILIFGVLAFLGSAINGNNIVGQLFWIALGLFLIHRGKEKEEEKKSRESQQNSAAIDDHE